MEAGNYVPRLQKSITKIAIFPHSCIGKRNFIVWQRKLILDLLVLVTHLLKIAEQFQIFPARYLFTKRIQRTLTLCITSFNYLRRKFFIKWVRTLISSSSRNKLRNRLLLWDLFLLYHATPSITSASDLIWSALYPTLVITLIASAYWPSFALIYFKINLLI